MSDPYIIFNGVKSTEVAGIGVIMQQLPTFERPTRIVSFDQVPGRDGRLEQDDEVYDAYSTSMKVNCNGVDLRDVYAWLSGSGWLISSDEPDRAVWASLYMQMKGTRFRAGACFDSITVPVYCQPFRYFYPQPAPLSIITSPGLIENPGTIRSAPIITIKGTGNVSVMLGQYQMDFEDLTDGIIVDCEAEECFSLDGAQLLNGLVDMDEFPKLMPGANYVQWLGEGTITEMLIDRRCRDL